MIGEFLNVDAIVEVPRGSRNKYEFDTTSETIRLDRVLHSSVHYPGDYGFIVGTRSSDGDPLDVLILVEEPTFPGCRVRVRPIGVLFMEDEGAQDEKILGVPEGDPRFAEVCELNDLPHHWLLEVEQFFATYKALEGKVSSTATWKGAKEACLVVAKRWCHDHHSSHVGSLGSLTEDTTPGIPTPSLGTSVPRR
jgi:inorganic pyrophosphatase